MCQDLAVRALAEPGRVPGDPAGFTAWALAEADTAGRAALGAQELRVELGELAHRAGPTDVPWEVSRRMALEAVLRRLAEMPEVDRRAVLAGLDYGAEPTSTRTREVAVRRHRARRKLRKLLRRFVLPVVGVRQTLRLVPSMATGLAVTVAATVVPWTRVSQPPEQRGTPASAPVEPAQVTTYAPPAPGRAPSPPRPVPGADPTPPRPEPSRSPAGTVVEGPGGTKVEYREEDPPEPDPPLLCVWVKPVHEVCVL